jgi:DNA-binding transcriptional ArsR family regulator
MSATTTPTIAQVVLHPERLRILQRLAGQRRLTVRELTAELDGVPQTSAYRHVRLLHDAGLLTIVEERAVRGQVERVYALARADNPYVHASDVAQMTDGEILGTFTTVVAGLLARLDDAVERRVDGIPPLSLLQVLAHLDGPERRDFVQ